MMRRIRRFRGRAAGFTLVESIIVLLFVTVLIALGVPALQQMIHRSRIEGVAREAAVMCQSARLEAIKSSTPTSIRFFPVSSNMVTWTDNNADGVIDAGERELVNKRLPTGVDFVTPEGNPIEGLMSDGDGAWLTFNTNGSIVVDDSAPPATCGDAGYGCVRFGDSRANFLQMKIGPIATAHVEIRKWNGTKWVSPGDDGKPWEWK